VVKEHKRLADDAGEQADGPVDAVAAAQEILEAAALEVFELGVVGGEERVERLGEDVDYRGEVLAAPVEGGHLFQNERGVGKEGHGGRGEERGDQDDVIEGHRHAAACEGVAHIEGVAEEDEAPSVVCGCRQERVGHASEGARVQCC